MVKGVDALAGRQGIAADAPRAAEGFRESGVGSV